MLRRELDLCHEVSACIIKKVILLVIITITLQNIINFQTVLLIGTLCNA